MNGTALTATFFDGTTAPTSGNGFHQYDSLSSYSGTGYAVGGYGSTDGFFTGELKFLRFYNRSLSNAEVAHNRRVDNYRYFGIYEPETTNVVVCSTYSYLEGYDKCGPYEVDGSYTFVAPESVTAANGITYVCDGYTVETMKADGNWGAAVSYDTNAYTATDSGTVRLTWRWKATHGLRTAADYDVTDYVAAGLKLHFDGLVNAGIDASSRSTTATKWVNLGSNGAVSDATLTKGSGSSSAWTDDGYYFDGNAKFTIPNAGIKADSSYTLQLLMDADRSIQKLDSEGKGQHDYFFSGSYNKLAVSVWGRNNAYLRAGVDVNFGFATGEHLTYFTGMMDQTGGSPVAYVFPGASISSAKTSTSASLTTPAVNNPILGAWGGGTEQYGIGTIKNFRYYDRPLTDAELAHNREVDQTRYFGALATTNVFVQTKFAAGGEQAESGAYKVEGSWDFTATTVRDRSGAVVPVAGYYTETLVNGEWSKRKWHSGTTYFYEEGTSPACVRLTWGPLPDGMMLLVR